MDKREYEKSKSRAMFLLTARPYSEHQIREKLSKNYAPETVDETIIWLLEREFLDDRKFAENTASYLRRVKKYGAIRIKNELKLKGVPDDIIKDIIASEKEADPAEIIKERIQKKHTENLLTREGEAKIYASMARYGFLYKDVKKAIFELKNEL
jgi:regulatory protein